MKPFDEFEKKKLLLKISIVLEISDNLKTKYVFIEWTPFTPLPVHFLNTVCAFVFCDLNLVQALKRTNLDF